MESFKEFCEGYVGEKEGYVYQRNHIFNLESLTRQYKQISKAVECNRKRGAIKNE